MSQFVFKQITDHTIQQGYVRIHDNMLFEVGGYFVIVLSHRRLVDIYQLSHKIGEVNWAEIHVKRSSFSLGKIESGIQQLLEPVQAFDCFPDGLAPPLISFIAQGGFERSANQCYRAFEVVRDTASNRAKLIYRRLKSVQHAIKGFGQSRDFI
jgi:hypothetical protein